MEEEHDIIVSRIGKEIISVIKSEGKITLNYDKSKPIVGTVAECRYMLSVIGVTDFTKIDEYVV